MDQVATIRRFSRAHTQRIGVSESYLTADARSVRPGCCTRSVPAKAGSATSGGSPSATRALDRYYREPADRFRFHPPPGGGTDLVALTAPAGTFLVARSDERVVGCGGLRRLDGATGEIKRMWIDPEWRGCGPGRLLLAALEDAARQLGRTNVVLDTNGALGGAIALYHRAGYRDIERYNDNPDAEHWFGKQL